MTSNYDRVARTVYGVLCKSPGFELRFYQLEVNDSKQVCSAPELGALIRMMGLEGLRSLLPLSEKEFLFVLEMTPEENTLHTADRKELLSKVEEHYNECKCCRLMEKKHKMFDTYLEQAMHEKPIELMKLVNECSTEQFRLSREFTPDMSVSSVPV